MEGTVPKAEERVLEEVPSASELSLSDSSDDSPVVDKGEMTPKQQDDESSDSIVEQDPPLPTSLPHFRSSSSGSFVGSSVIGPTNLRDLEKLVACPCCQQCFDGSQPKATLNEPRTAIVTNHHHHHAHAARLQGSLLRCTSHDDEGDDDIEDDEDILPGVLATGVHYSPRRILVEGWLHKKGTGKDWLGSRAWKARWARLALARVDGYSVDVPLLLIYWFPASTTASTVIVLDSTVVLAVDLEDKQRWNAYRFEIRHVAKAGNTELPVTRTFSAAARKGRDAWVYAISQSLLSYEKQKDKSRKLAAFRVLSRSRSLSPERSKSLNIDVTWAVDPSFDKIERQQQHRRKSDSWTRDRCHCSTTIETRPPPRSPPNSPPSRGQLGRKSSSTNTPTSPPLPRPGMQRSGSVGATSRPNMSSSLLSQPSI